MKYLKKKKRNILPVIVVLGCVIVLVVAGMILIQAKRPEQETVAVPATTVAKQETVTAEVLQTTETEPPMVAIETPYCTLYYPEQWADNLRTEITGEEFDMAVGFYGTVAQEEYLLFTLYFGGAEGFPAGVLEIQDGVMLDVTLDIADLEMNDSWNQEETERICAMQEAMNDVLSYLEMEEKFVPAN